MPLAPRDDPSPLGIDLSAFVRPQDFHERTPIQSGRWLDAADFHERRRQVRQSHEVIDDATPLVPRHADRQGNCGAVVVEVALARRNARHAMVAANNDERPVQLARLFKLSEEHAEVGIERLALT